ncbi:DUF930 domain-containing protein [Rhizobium sp. DBTS2]|uniref:DUF930 domain-containing protein n=1 Tax=Mycoplana rhizolycopersici TaxID=2746702 RepID=A0ABX2QJA8_9HYPH|nr:DUF930 domain-containing protein [Rhizobium rhizolycopersici]NVP57876.1 DUF930 domain-containing protein [Rhizobium rhizolycopersici]
MEPRVTGKRGKGLGWGVGVSAALHVAIAALLFVHLPAFEVTPPEEESVSVELVPPPEENVPEEAQQEPPPPEEQQEEKVAEAPPPPPTPPPPPPPPAAEPPEEPPPEETAPEETAAEEKPPEEQMAEEQQQAEEQQRAVEQLADGAPIPVLRPVLEYGDKDSGVKVETDDLSPGSPLPEEETADKPPEQQTPSEQPVAEELAEDAPATAPVPTPSEPDSADGFPTALAEGEPIDGTAQEEAAKADEQPKAEDKTADKAEASDAPETKLHEADRLFSENAAEDPVARTAIGDLPRSVRIERLCSTELYAQLRHGSPAYNPELLPSYRLSKGTVLEVTRAAFRANTRWYNLSFRCEVDEEGTRVVAFAFDVGSEVPKSEWRKRGFPSL